MTRFWEDIRPRSKQQKKEVRPHTPPDASGGACEWESLGSLSGTACLATKFLSGSFSPFFVEPIVQLGFGMFGHPSIRQQLVKPIITTVQS